MNTLVIALGANDIAVPCLVFETRDKAIEFMRAMPGLREYEVKSLPQWRIVKEEAEEYFKDTFFTWYYGGCGGVYAFRLHEPEEGMPFLHWSLD